MTFRQISLLLLLSAGLAACQSNQAPQAQQPATQSLDKLLATQAKPNAAAPLQLPDAVNQALAPDSQPQPLFETPKYDVLAEQAEVQEFFNGLIADTPYSVAVHPEVTGKISLNLKQVDLQQVFDLVADLYGFDIQRNGNIYRIFPAGLRTQTFTVNYLLMQRAGFTQSSISSGGISQNNANGNNNNSGSNGNNFTGNAANGNNIGGQSFNSNANGTNISTRTETDFWQDLTDTLQSLIGTEQGRSVVVSPQAGLVTVRAMPDEMRAVEDFLTRSEQIVKRQVILEARIIEVSLSDEYQQGINWNQVLANSGSTDFRFSTTAGNLGNSISASLGGITSLSFLNKDFSGVLSLLETQGNVQVLSSPRVTATNNQKAVIKVGDDEYFVTEISSQNTITSSSTQVTPNIELTPFFSGIALDVTPQIDDQGGVLLHVHPSVIETQEQEKIVTLNEEQFVLPLAQSNIRESDTVIHANSGEIVVIGGLMQSTTSNKDSKTPVLGSIPLLGELFKSRRESEIKRELVILLKPTVVGPNTWREQMQQSRQQMAEWLYVDE